MHRPIEIRHDALTTARSSWWLPAILCSACFGSSTESPVDGGGVDGDLQPVGVEVRDLGSIDDGAIVELEVPPRALGFQVVVELDGSTGTEEVGIRTVRSPSGEALVTEFVPVGHVVPIGGTPFGAATLSFPQTSSASAMPLAAGAWKLEIDLPTGRTAHARAFIRTTEDGEFHGGTLDVRIYIPEGLMLDDPAPAHTVTAATAATDPGVTTRVDSFFTTLSSMFELDRGTVEFLPLPAKFATIDSDAERLEALAQTVPFADGFGIHLVWTGELLVPTSQWANSAWVPGLPNAAPRSLAGITIDVDNPYPAAADGMTMVHELGHFFGLFHTSEANRMFHDPIADTPECISTDSVCPDRLNIMFPGFYGASAGIGLSATAQQRRVVHGSPWYRAR